MRPLTLALLLAASAVSARAQSSSVESAASLGRIEITPDAINTGMAQCRSQRDYQTVLGLFRERQRAGEVALEYYESADIAAAYARLEELNGILKFNRSMNLDLEPKEKTEAWRLLRLYNVYKKPSLPDSPALSMEYPRAVGIHASLEMVTEGDCGMAAFVIAHELAHLENNDLLPIDGPSTRTCEQKERAADLRGLELIRGVGIDAAAAQRFFTAWDQMYPASGACHGNGAARCRNLGLANCGG